MPTQNKFTRSLFNPDEFTITYELVPGQGSGGQRVDRLLTFAGEAFDDGRVKALSITDNPGGHPALAPIAIGSEIQRIGIEPLLHFSLKDKNRNQVESHLFHYHRQHFTNLLVLGGDFPKAHYFGQAKPVFDLDSVQALQLLRDMEEGTYHKDTQSRQPSFDPLFFNRGCVVSPFKTCESEQVWQYAKLIAKIRAGAHFVVTQLGYDICKFEELALFMRENNLNIPVLANVFIPSLPVARHMLRGMVPGIVFPAELVARMEREKDNGDTRARLVRAAEMVAVLKGLGFSGVHLGGNGLSFADIRFVLDTADDLEGDWQNLRHEVHYPVAKTWYYFPPEEPGTCGRSRRELQPGRSCRDQVVHIFMHSLFFSPPNLTSRLFGRFCRFCAATRLRTSILRSFETWLKRLLFYCRMCGDCTLAESTYLCPQSGCPKKLLNGPCGGSRNMTCEVHPERYCFWVRVYNRLPRFTAITELVDRPFLPPKDWSLEGTSSWINFYTGSDHHAITRGNPAEKPEGNCPR